MRVGELVGHPPNPYIFKEDEQAWAAPRLPVGVEIELENPNRVTYRLPELEKYWTIQADGSLRDAGFELVFTQPFFGKDLTNALEVAEKFVTKNKVVCNYRTGLHVHLDSRDLDLQELKRIFVLYALYERALFSFVGEDRINSNFCTPWYRVSDHLDGIFSIFREESSNKMVKETLRNVDRYSALNCNALDKFGSLEFRHLQMTPDFEKIRQWINVLMALYNASRLDSQWGPKVPVEALINFAAKGGAGELTKAIFPEWFWPYMTDKATWEGIFLMQEISSDIEHQWKFDGASPIQSICPTGENPSIITFRNNAKERA